VLGSNVFSNDVAFSLFSLALAQPLRFLAFFLAHPPTTKTKEQPR
jgi:hypothetical protein